MTNKLENYILDEKYKTPNVPEDDTVYSVGRIRDHYIVIAICLKIGTYLAATVVTNIYYLFWNIKHIFMVGIASKVLYYSVNLLE